MKLIIQIPCLNEEKTLGETLKDLPKHIKGIDVIELLVIDDGSTDRTSELAKSLGVHHVVRFPQNRGLARAFEAGIERALAENADIIVNTDADNQYNGTDIETIVRPILDGKAEMVIGARPIGKIQHFSPIKKLLQYIGSWVVRLASKTDIPDAPSGFRAMSRGAAMKLNVFNEYTYTLETIIQAGQKGIALTSVPIRVNGDLRPSRLVKSIASYIKRSIITIVRIFMAYQPFHFFVIPGMVSAFLGFLIGLRFLYFFFVEGGGGHIQSLILALLLFGCGFFLITIGLLADLISVNRKLLEKIDWKVQKLSEKIEK
ncbi:MAG: glycosyltransferase family 2 protein [Oligoflexales bacterium]